LNEMPVLRIGAIINRHRIPPPFCRFFLQKRIHFTTHDDIMKAGFTSSVTLLPPDVREAVLFAQKTVR